MANLNHIVLGFLLLQTYVYAASAHVFKLEENVKIEHTDPEFEQTEPKLDSEPREVESDESTETQRHKRWQYLHSHGLPPFNPCNPDYNNKGEGPSTGDNPEHPLAKIYRWIQENVNLARQTQKPLPPQFPMFYAVFFITPFDCNNDNENQTPPLRTYGSDNIDDTTPTLLNRWSGIEDEKENRGVVMSEANPKEDLDYSRPISFDPIEINAHMRPAPPVEHGTVQSDSDALNQPQADAPNSQTTLRTTQPPQNRPTSDVGPPSTCDAAILKCCHQPQVIKECFEDEGCHDISGFENPCGPDQMKRVLDMFWKHYLN